MKDRAARVRVVGPLALYASGFRTVLVGRGYAPSSAAGQLQVMGHLSRWLAEHGRDGRDLTSAVVEEFLLVRRAAGYRQWLSMRGMSPLLDYLREVGVAPAGSPIVVATPVEIALAAYETYLVEERGLSASTVRNYLSVARQFVSWRGGPQAAGFDGLTASEVSEFVLAACRPGSRGSGTLLVVGMRALLRYLHVAGITGMGLAGAVPPAAAWPSSLPQPIDRRSAAQLLASCDRRTALGRRDFAVLTLLVRLGLRVSEVAALELRDMHWRHGEVLVRGKGGREEVLPLPTDVGEAIAGWLRHRPLRCTSTRVFTSVIAPHGDLTGKAVSGIVSRAAHRSGVSVSAHRLRHCAASELLRAGASLPEVAQVLRHTSMLNTVRYAKIDHAALSQVARPWPAGAR